MSKKKIIGLCIAGVLVVGSIGGSLAWFTSSDSVTNPFSTASTDNPSDPNSGIKINEKFNKEEADNTNLLESVTLSKDTTNEFKGLKFDVVVDSEGVQAANGAVNDSWKDAPQAIKTLGAKTNAHK